MLGVVVVIALLVGGCGTSDPLPSGGAGSPAVDGPSPTLGLTSRLAEFEGRLREATAAEGTLVQKLAAASVGTAADMRRAVAQMRDWVASQRAWLADHPAEPCYDAAATKLEAALAAMTSAADQSAAISSVASPGPSDDAAGAAAAQSLQDAAQALVDAAALAKTDRPNCR